MIERYSEVSRTIRALKSLSLSSPQATPRHRRRSGRIQVPPRFARKACSFRFPRLILTVNPRKLSFLLVTLLDQPFVQGGGLVGFGFEIRRLFEERAHGFAVFAEGFVRPVGFVRFPCCQIAVSPAGKQDRVRREQHLCRSTVSQQGQTVIVGYYDQVEEFLQVRIGGEIVCHDIENRDDPLGGFDELGRGAEACQKAFHPGGV